MAELAQLPQPISAPPTEPGAAPSSPTALRPTTSQVLLEGIEELATKDQVGARVLRHHFADDNTLYMVANKLNVSDHSVSRLQRSAASQLSFILHGREHAGLS